MPALHALRKAVCAFLSGIIIKLSRLPRKQGMTNPSAYGILYFVLLW